MIKRFEEYNLNENLGYKTIFGKEVSHEEALQKTIRDLIINIIVDERNISEKSFKEYDKVISEVKQLCIDNPEIYEKAQEYYEKDKRLKLLAEECYDKYYKKGKN
jgi:hypothetical protein